MQITCPKRILARDINDSKTQQQNQQPFKKFLPQIRKNTLQGKTNAIDKRACARTHTLQPNSLVIRERQINILLVYSSLPNSMSMLKRTAHY